MKVVVKYLRKSSKQIVSFRPFLNKVSKRTIWELKNFCCIGITFLIPNELSDVKIDSSFFIIESTDDLTIDGMFKGFISSIPTIIFNTDCNMASSIKK